MGKKVIDDCFLASCPKDPRQLEELHPQTVFCSNCARNVYNCSGWPGQSDWRRIAPFTDTLPSIHPEDVVLITEGNLENFEATVDEIDEHDQAASIYLNLFAMQVPFWISMRYLRRVPKSHDDPSQGDALG
jgi:hypothetical protein